MAVRMNTQAIGRLEDNAVQGTLLALLHKHVECYPKFVIAGQWNPFLKNDRDLWKADLLGAGAVLVRCDALVTELRACFDQQSAFRVANLVFFSGRGELQITLPRRPRRNTTIKRHRDLWDDQGVPDERKNEVFPMELQDVDKQSPLLRAQQYLCTDLSEIRNGDRPLDMFVTATPRGVVVGAMDELRLSDIDHMISSAQLIAARFTHHRSAAEASVEIAWPAVPADDTLEIVDAAAPSMQVYVNVATVATATASAPLATNPGDSAQTSMTT